MALQPRIVAHRGASAYAPDNTLTAYRLAAEQGAALIELDIQRSADDQIVVFHDPFVTLPGGRERRVEALPFAALRALRLDQNEQIPAFEDVVALCRQLQMGIYVEFKGFSERLAQQAIDVLTQGGILDQCVLFGARPDHVFYVKHIAPQVRTCFSYRQAGIDPVEIAAACRADGLNLAWEDYPDPFLWLTNAWFAKVRARGLRLMSWHEERTPFLRRLIALGIDDICTNDPALARRLITKSPGFDDGAITDHGRVN